MILVAESSTKIIRRGPKQGNQPSKSKGAIGSRSLSQFSKSLPPELKAQKFTSPDKHYRLIWVLGDRFWLCSEDEGQYRKVHGPGGVVEAGKALAEKLGARFKE